MINKTLYKIFVFVISSIMLSVYILIVYFTVSNVYSTMKNWNILIKGKIVNSWIDTNNSESYHAKMYDVEINNSIFLAKTEIETNYLIGDEVLVQNKGNKTVRILYVNGIKVADKMNMTEYLSIFFLTIMLLITLVIIKNKLK